MNYPTLYAKQAERQMVDVFKGYNHNLRIGDGEFFDMKNMTSDYYPVLSPRRARGEYELSRDPKGLNGLIAKDALCYVDGTDFVINEYHIDMGLSDGPKQLISMGAYVIIMPDKKWINTATKTKNTFEHGSIDEIAEITNGYITFSLCRVDGAEYGDIPTIEPPESERDSNTLWIDTSSSPHVLKQWSKNAGMWVSVGTTYIRISADGIGKSFEQYDGITISGLAGTAAESLEGSAVIWSKEDNAIVVVGILDEVFTLNAADHPVTIQRRMPEVDYVIESGNRLWGCKYGFANSGQVVNEIYASKLGDFKNWNCFMGISTDSWAASVGSDGVFTGAVTHMGYPIFFKEDCMHKIYGTAPTNFQIQTTACRGVQKDCSRSLAIVNERLYYLSRSGVMVYDGSLPVEASYVLGECRYGNAVAGSHRNKYYISMEDNLGKQSLFVLDTAKGMWHKEDDLKAEAFCSCDEELYCIANGKIVTVFGSGNQDERTVEWMAQTGDIGLSSPDMKYISRLTVRMSMDIGSTVHFYAQYDFSDAWEHLFTMHGTSLRSFSIPIRPKRCDHMKLRIEGTGPARIYSITKTIEQGSDVI